MILIVLVGLPILAQEEFHLPPAVLAAGGSSGGESIILSHWRLARVHSLTISENLILSDNDFVQDFTGLGQLISVYPNPVEEFLYLKFDLTEARDFIIKLSDITGRVLLINDDRTVQADETLEFDLSRFASALYLFQISTTDRKEYIVFRIQKI
ncbi:MAG: hypothetical protein AMS23_05330 [Bacteroides sp. SM1_62]|nr:MAG: hypothetical protein AMS26_19945 [Bacteroides sp. SM23_62]KPL24766.1 MAG: hypothetical protein AMS23_05330 [Bacteroides sp. SM1_62]